MKRNNSKEHIFDENNNVIRQGDALVDENCLFFNNDCFSYLESISSSSVDLVLIDPPYEISRKTNYTSGELKNNYTDRFRVSMEFGEWDKCFTGLDIVIRECYRVLKKHGTIICFYDIWKIETLKKYFDDAGFSQIRFAEWLKTNPVPLNSKVNYLTGAREACVVGVKGGKPTFHSSYDNGVYQYPICHDKGRFHPTQKPLALIEDIIVKHSNTGDLVLDCFAGSATTAIAALNKGRRFTGCEIDPGFFDQAKKRITNQFLKK